jgi:hypothetical protein
MGKILKNDNRNEPQAAQLTQNPQQRFLTPFLLWNSPKMPSISVPPHLGITILSHNVNNRREKAASRLPSIRVKINKPTWQLFFVPSIASTFGSGETLGEKGRIREDFDFLRCVDDDAESNVLRLFVKFAICCTQMRRGIAE